MSMPKFPDDSRPRSRRQLVNNILESVALEELAMAHLINAEAEKIQSFAGSYGGFPTNPTNKEIIEFQGYVVRILEALTEKQNSLGRTLKFAREALNEDAERVYEEEDEEECE